MALYHRAASVHEAVARHRALPGSAYLAGGQSLLAALNRHECEYAQLIDVRAIGELRERVLNADGLRIGAAVTLAELLADSAIVQAWPVLAETLASVANHTIRHHSTVGGHVALADGLSEVNLLLLTAEASVLTDKRELAIGAALSGHRHSTLAPHELVLAVHVPRPMLEQDYGFCEFTLRASGGRAMAACALRVAAGVMQRAVFAGLSPAPIVLHGDALNDVAYHLRAQLEASADAEPTARWPPAYRLELALEALARASHTLQRCITA